jgi:hypothetical protein
MAWQMQTKHIAGLDCGESFGIDKMAGLRPVHATLKTRRSMIGQRS